MDKNKTVAKAVFVAFEGLDGAGKSDISKMAADKLGAEWMSTPSREFSRVREIADREYQGCGLSAQLFYASTVVHASVRIQAALAAGRSVVVDRYAASTLAYDKSARDSGIDDRFWIDEIFGNIAVPDITLYFQVSPEVRRRRMDARAQKNDTDRASIGKADKLHSRYQSVFDMLRKRSWKIISVQNEGTKEECVEKCMRAIAEKQGAQK